MGHVEAHTTEPKQRAGGRPIVDHVTLSSEERARLEALVRRTTAPQAHVRRATIALDADEGVGTVELARRLSLSSTDGLAVEKKVRALRGRDACQCATIWGATYPRG